MAFQQMTENDVYDLRDSLEGYQETRGEDEFTEGALAVCAWLLDSNHKSTVEDFFKDNDITR